ncbi:MaoC family dehydratase [Coralliovum pocilloporae]|uniref:MaoC family dehydratase n=1 Tax=Coralliovum pocilloporae TaxID=3066369 RepID=UPI003306F537
MKERPVLPLSDLEALIGQDALVSDWLLVDQDRIDAFAAVSDDHQFIHCDPERAAAETPFGGTIAHGFLTLSLLSFFGRQAMPIPDNVAMSVNYGFDKLRFLAPVRAGKRIRALFGVHSLKRQEGERVLVRYTVSIEIENEDKPALAALWSCLFVLQQGSEKLTDLSGKSSL